MYIIITNEAYVRQSLDLNLFFLRIMKEHSLFMAVEFPPKFDELIKEATNFNHEFNNLLTTAVNITSRVQGVRNDAVTKYTVEAEKATASLTGFNIDTNLSVFELSLVNRPQSQITQAVIEEVNALNNQAIRLTQGLIDYKTKVIDGVLNCTVFNGNYVLLLDHIRREAILFVDLLNKIQQRTSPNVMEEAIRQEIFWNRIMGEHAFFIRGLLDPTEVDLFNLANNFGHEFSELNKKALQMSEFPQVLPQVTNDSLRLTREIQGFKTQGTEGILACKIKSLILPLLGDHVIREANHFLILLESYKFQS